MVEINRFSSNHLGNGYYTFQIEFTYNNKSFFCERVETSSGTTVAYYKGGVKLPERFENWVKIKTSIDALIEAHKVTLIEIKYGSV